MYFFAHTYILLKAQEKKAWPKKILKPLLLGTWAPDAGFFPFLSWQLKHFNHTHLPTIQLFHHKSFAAKLFLTGWQIHIACDNIIHNEGFFYTGEPLCPEIRKNQGLRVLLQTAREHLGREVSLDLLLHKKALKNKENTIMNIIRDKSYFQNPIVNYSGLRYFQKYVYYYINKGLPILTANTILAKKMRKLFQYDFFQKKNHFEKSIHIITKATNKAKEILENNINS